MRRAERLHGRSFAAEETVVVGGTPKDIACGKAPGAMTVCVATGNFEAEELRAEGADLVVESFTESSELMATLRSHAKNGH